MLPLLGTQLTHFGLLWGHTQARAPALVLRARLPGAGDLKAADHLPADRSRVPSRPWLPPCVTGMQDCPRNQPSSWSPWRTFWGKSKLLDVAEEESQRGDSILAKGMTTHPPAFLLLYSLQHPRARLTQLKEGDTETGKGLPGAISALHLTQ